MCHRCTRTDLLLLGRMLIRRSYLYKDVPYCCRFPTRTAALERALEDVGAAPEAVELDISDVRTEKLEALAIYASQWKIEKLAPLVPSTEALVRIRVPGVGV